MKETLFTGKKTIFFCNIASSVFFLEYFLLSWIESTYPRQGVKYLTL